MEKTKRPDAATSGQNNSLKNNLALRTPQDTEFAFSGRRLPCPVCGARRGFAPLVGHTDAGKCFACNAFLPPSTNEDAVEHRSRGQGRDRATDRLLLEAQPSTDWRKVPILTTYDYHDEEGKVLFHVDRKERRALYRYANGREEWEREKTFAQRPHGIARPYQGCMDNVRRVLYRLPCILQAVRYSWPVVIVEGEKDADTYNDLFREELAYDACATCCPGGAGKWLTYGRGYVETLNGADVIVDGDMDSAGIKHVRTIAESLHGTAKRVRIVEDMRVAMEGRI